MYAADQISGLLVSALAGSVEALADACPLARMFAREPQRIPPHVLLRHNAEHVFRIRGFRPLDRAATEALCQADPALGAEWARYARSEAVHDRYFRRDLAQAGVDVEGLQPFPATDALIGFVDGAVGDCGALPVVVYSFWTEHNSDRGSAGVIARAGALFGADGIRGAAAHRRLDEGQDHVTVVCRVLAALLHTPDDAMLAVSLLECITALIGAYFGELEAWARSAPAWPAGAVSRVVAASPGTAR
jgi:hypothetical protein